jgi:glycosyltransferase involved in cell wall biosynthesis
MNWAIITGAYPPDDGGMADYTKSVAESLAAKGDKIWVWSGSTGESFDDPRGLRVRRLPGLFGLRALYQLSRELRDVPQPRQILIQHVPQAFGPNFGFRSSRFRGLTLAFCLWLQFLREPAWVMFHELIIPAGKGDSMPLRFLSAMTCWMMRLIVRKCSRVFVSVPAWTGLIRKSLGPGATAEWLPVPSNVEADVDWASVKSLRYELLDGAPGALIGHFGTFGPRITEILEPVLERALDGDPSRRAVLVGRGSQACAARFIAAHPRFITRVIYAEDLPPAAVVRYLAACEVVVEPYPDGVSSRRSSTMAPLGAGLPVICNAGVNTEPIWRESGAVALVDGVDPALFAGQVERLLADPEARCELAGRALRLYRERFSLEHTVEAMCVAAGSVAGLNPSSTPPCPHPLAASR